MAVLIQYVQQDVRCPVHVSLESYLIEELGMAFGHICPCLFPFHKLIVDESAIRIRGKVLLDVRTRRTHDVDVYRQTVESVMEQKHQA